MAFLGRRLRRHLPSLPLPIADRRGQVRSRIFSGGTVLRELQIGDHVRIQDLSTQCWSTTGRVVERLRSRRYLVRADDGRVYRRNRRYLLPTPTSSVPNTLSPAPAQPVPPAQDHFPYTGALVRRPQPALPRRSRRQAGIPGPDNAFGIHFNLESSIRLLGLRLFRKIATHLGPCSSPHIELDGLVFGGISHGAGFTLFVSGSKDHFDGDSNPSESNSSSKRKRLNAVLDKITNICVPMQDMSTTNPLALTRGTQLEEKIRHCLSLGWELVPQGDFVVHVLAAAA
eukprot:snap_masked-scaffold686_size111872-processed-gene-0.2 protein:Tk10829 transcript:snap_masked-scaffold686_size111872-processed-gene-0.2-mRNA-1 annotation:"hypothetical protein DAPPUDRAFT_116736"